MEDDKSKNTVVHNLILAIYNTDIETELRVNPFIPIREILENYQKFCIHKIKKIKLVYRTKK